MCEQCVGCLQRRIVSSSSPGVSWEARVIVTWLSSPYLGIVLFPCRCLFLWRPLLLPLESGWKELLAYFPIVPSRSRDSTSKNDHFSSHIDDFQTPGPQRTWPRAGRPALPWSVPSLSRLPAVSPAPPGEPPPKLWGTAQAFGF